MEAMNVYQIQYSAAHFDEAFTTFQIAPTPGKAKSAEFRSFSDYDPDAKYLEFLKMVKVRKIGQSTPKRNEAPYPGQDRIDLINELIRVIGRSGRKFLYSKQHNRFAAFHWADGQLWLVDDYTDRPLLMDESVPGQHYHFSHGGTLWGLMCDFRDYILGDDDANHNNGYGGLYSPHLGYPEEDMDLIRAYAIEIGYLKPWG
ncbi:hypothetical protein C161_27398 [Paenibacillus sp. FSL R5-192]|uniref:hypothetical protein n=1 Tax=Paenibacillus sp. FSL R5-192 TaxID=1226754 RepID=UPI0003E1D8DA|nr:hypothetical protein [Paenibacillus sp. FSL R5-192]ETT30702.1 hypothetical protein C161_27398 [Paenibacillus sp. FSL R5-192]